MTGTELRPIAHMESDFGTKFGIPRQAGMVKELMGRIVFEPEYRQAETLRGIEEFSHLWLIWQFSENVDAPWSPTVRPPRFGGNVRQVFNLKKGVSQELAKKIGMPIDRVRKVLRIAKSPISLELNKLYSILEGSLSLFLTPFNLMNVYSPDP